MSRILKIAPSILSCDFNNLATECNRMINSGADYLHIDVMDGHFVPNISFGPLIPAAIHKTLPNAFLDVHLMVTDPLKWINVFADSGASSITFHIEVGNVTEIISAIRKRGIRVGIALKPDTDVTSVFEFVDQIDMMTVEPGFGGQKFMQNMMPKVKDLREKYPSLDIQVDGGIGLDNIETVAKNGANVVVAGTSIFGAQSPADVITKFREAFKVYI